MASQWAHGDTPLHTLLNEVSTGLDALHARFLNTRIRMATPHQYGSGNIYRFVHRYRWLHFKSTGQIKNAAGTLQATLSPVNDTYTSFDLQSLSWLAYGDMYQVVGCEMASEERTA